MRRRLNPRQQQSCFRFEDRDSVVGSGKSPHRLDRVEQVDDHKLNPIPRIAAQNITATVASDFLQAGKNLGLQKSFVGIRILRLGPPSPMSRYHGYLSAALTDIRIIRRQIEWLLTGMQFNIVDAL